MTTLDYVILAGLIRKPRSGYDLTRWMERETSHFFVIGHSSIYPALARMEREGLVRHEVVPSDRGPERKVYSITEAGRDALLAWKRRRLATRRNEHNTKSTNASSRTFSGKATSRARRTWGPSSPSPEGSARRRATWSGARSRRGCFRGRIEHMKSIVLRKDMASSVIASATFPRIMVKLFLRKGLL